jgi:pimeloyl-ACP methyl ester carboxylesterase
MTLLSLVRGAGRGDDEAATLRRVSLPVTTDPGVLMELVDCPRGHRFANCLGQRDPAILDSIWNAVRARDPLGSSWDSSNAVVGGVQRAPSWDVWGWNSERAANVTLPALVITGLLDRTNPPEREVRLFDDLGSGNKVLIKIACASHQALWEGSTTGSWGGPHRSIREALVEWITSRTFEGIHRGSFQINADGLPSRD